MRQLAIVGSGGQWRVALLEDGRLLEWRTQVQSEEAEGWAGEIFLGRVRDVRPGIQSAFVDIGLARNAYLYVDDAGPSDRALIQEKVREGEKLLVQVIKEGSELKAPKLTTKISLQGKYLVFLPLEKGIAISRKIADPAVRQRLHDCLHPLLAEAEGLVVRTQSADADEHSLVRELGYLRGRWQQITRLAQEKSKLGRICLGAEWVENAMRDQLAAGVDEIWVEHADTYQLVKELLGVWEPDGQHKLRRYQEKEPLMSRLGIEAQLQNALQRQVALPSGGFLVFDKTEAMTVIDVNTGSFTGKGGQQREQAVTHINLEAAKEIATQLRLREIGGVVVIDFIDMKEAANKERLLATLKRELAKDPVPSTVLGMTALGLVEMTRKRVRSSLAERVSVPCETCGGRGSVWSVEEMEQRLLGEVTALARVQEVEAVLVELPTRLYHHIDTKSASTGRLWPVELYKLHRAGLSVQEYQILYAGDRQEAQRLYRRQTQIT